MDYSNKYYKYKLKYLKLIGLGLGSGSDRLEGGAKPKPKPKSQPNPDFQPKQIYFIRHGQSIYNQLGKTQGAEADIELSEDGIQTAHITGKYLHKYRAQDEQFDCVISSPMIRAKQTAEIIAGELGYTKDILYLDYIKECAKGNLSGLTNDDPLMAQLNKAVKEKLNTMHDPIEKYMTQSVYSQDKFYNSIIESNHIDVLGVEPSLDLVSKAKQFIDWIEKTKYNKIIVISHSGFLEVLLKIIFNLNVLPKGNTSNGNNCTICYCTYKNNVFNMISPQNSEHLALAL